MKIQEMRSGISHLNRKVEVEGRNNVFEIRQMNEALPGPDLPSETQSELDQPRWSVVSFEQREAGGLTYPQAAELISELDANDISGLCTVTDEAAARMAVRQTVCSSNSPGVRTNDR
jgi:hypothetical protein